MARNTIMTLALIAGLSASGGIAFAQTAPKPPEAAQETGPRGTAATGQNGPDAPCGWGMEKDEGHRKGRKGHHDEDRSERRGREGADPNGPGGAFMLQGFDADGDGFVTQAEAQAGLSAQVAQHDLDRDGALSLDEFSAMQAARMRDLFATQFQRLDASNDGKLDAAETGRIVERITAEGPVRVPRVKPPAAKAAPGTAADPAAIPETPQAPAAAQPPVATTSPAPVN